MRQSKKIAVASISSALAIILSIVSHYWGFATLSIGLMTSMATALPMIVYNNAKSSFLAYIVTSLVLILVINIYSIGYILFFGLYPFIIQITLKIPNKPLTYVVKITYFAALLLGLYFIAQQFIKLPVLEAIKEKSLFPLYMIIGIVFLLVYDYLWNLLFKLMQRRFKALDV